MYSSLYTIQYMTTLLFLMKFVVYFCARVSFTLPSMCLFLKTKYITYKVPQLFFKHI